MNKYKRTVETLMICKNCGYKDNYHSQYCMRCGHPLQASVPPDQIPPKGLLLAHGLGSRRKRGMVISISIAAALLAALILVLIFSANPVAGRWYAQDGTELIMLKNGKGMTLDGQYFYRQKPAQNAG